MAALIKAPDRARRSLRHEGSLDQASSATSQIEIIIPKAEKARARSDRTTHLHGRRAGIPHHGVATVRATSRHHRDRRATLPAGQNIVRIDGKEVARWVELRREASSAPSNRPAGTLVVRDVGSDPPQALVMTNDGLNVTGEYLRSAPPDVDANGRPAVTFRLQSAKAPFSSAS